MRLNLELEPEIAKLFGVHESFVMIEGAMNTEIFDLWVEQMLVPGLQPGDHLPLDNMKFHYSKWAIELSEAADATVSHLPGYSPDFNPIEEYISKIKKTVHSRRAQKGSSPML